MLSHSDRDPFIPRQIWLGTVISISSHRKGGRLGTSSRIRLSTKENLSFLHFSCISSFILKFPISFSSFQFAFDSFTFKPPQWTRGTLDIMILLWLSSSSSYAFLPLIPLEILWSSCLEPTVLAVPVGVSVFLVREGVSDPDLFQVYGKASCLAYFWMNLDWDRLVSTEFKRLKD